MQIKRDFTIQKVGSSYVAVAVGETSKTFHGMVRLNETGAFLWKMMAERDCTEDMLVDAILEEYDVDRNTVVADVRRIVDTLAANGIFIPETLILPEETSEVEEAAETEEVTETEEVAEAEEATETEEAAETEETAEAEEASESEETTEVEEVTGEAADDGEAMVADSEVKVPDTEA